ncbi:glycosyltransferase family 92 protein RCOM_0530710 [Cannabis sativa]|uniref:glycosyltransferase family 92 protein RCOM_0530710 n=1 Tax=Cannabis sativa TaxID=3483 RepID=UPI0029CA421A|nr:glycosyltransferase family 92 protein RCOM_0530710 [Cannabis sativa]
MDSEQRRKRKRLGKPYLPPKFCSVRSLVVCLSFFVFLLFLSSDRFPLSPTSFRPALSSSPTFTLFYSAASNSILDSFGTRRQQRVSRVEERILFPDHVLLLVAGARLRQPALLDCVYYISSTNGSRELIDEGRAGLVVRPALSTDGYDEFRSIVRCPHPPANYSAAVDLRRRGDSVNEYWPSSPIKRVVHSWDKVVYEAVLDRDTVVVFVKGLNLRPHRKSDPTQLRCRFGLKRGETDEGFVLTTPAITAAQEVVRCPLPRSIQINPEKAKGIRVTIGYTSRNQKYPRRNALPSAARINSSKSRVQINRRRNELKKKKKKHELCVCTMVWNQAPALREWIMYHAWLGIEGWFIYDNNSDDGIEEVVQELDLEGYNVSRQSWPWIKTQEAGFSHCALKAREECNWVGFFDVDEFFYLPNTFRQPQGLGFPGQNSLGELVANFSSSTSIAEIRTTCHSFGPSGLSSPPPKGVTVGYTCRLQSPERHKSIVRPELLDVTLLNVVHHFRLKEGYRYLNVPENIALINHYKYQVWDTFRAKFYRRVATYVVDWQEEQNKGSKDRAPGLGTAAIEPPNWKRQFCEVWDTGLRDFVLAYFADPATGSLPWELRSLSSSLTNSKQGVLPAR